MSPLDRLVRQSLLSYPLLFPSRWDVLLHLFLVIGNGYEWENGRLVSVMEREEFDEARARATFFRDLDELEDRTGTRPEDILRRARRQFQLDHIDDLVREDWVDVRPGGLSASMFLQVNTEYSHAFDVPDDVEESFRAGAIEVLMVVRQSMEYVGMRFGPQAVDIAAAAQGQLDRLRQMARR